MALQVEPAEDSTDNRGTRHSSTARAPPPLLSLPRVRCLVDPDQRFNVHLAARKFAQFDGDGG